MFVIKIPSNNIEERKYIITIILDELLGIDYKIEIEDRKNYEIILQNGNKLIIEDHFFSKFPKDLEYLQLENIPKKIEFGKNWFIVEENIPIIYGINKLITNAQSISCGIDVFASSFFMLTRWEEYVNTIRDNHNRFPAYASLAYQNNILDRPIINEYIEMLWNMLRYLGINQKRKKRDFKLILTHDVDHVFKYSSWINRVKEIGGDIAKRRNFKLAYFHFMRQIEVSMNRKRDPFDTFDYLMDISERNNTKSYFFLHSSIISKYDNNNSRFLKQIAEKIKKRGHNIGYHPSYDTYNNKKLFKKEKAKIESLINEELKFGRQHYLRFEIPTTWQLWEENKMEWDSTLSYADKEGFRCGICYPFSVFNILTRKKLELKERPLIVMDVSLTSYQSDANPKQIEEKIKKLMNKVKKYNGEFVFLWHNSSFNTSAWEQYQDIYEKVLG